MSLLVLIGGLFLTTSTVYLMLWRARPQRFRIISILRRWITVERAGDHRMFGQRVLFGWVCWQAGEWFDLKVASCGIRMSSCPEDLAVQLFLPLSASRRSHKRAPMYLWAIVGVAFVGYLPYILWKAGQEYEAFGLALFFMILSWVDGQKTLPHFSRLQRRK